MKTYIRNRCRAALARFMNRFRADPAAARNQSDEDPDWLGIG